LAVQRPVKEREETLTPFKTLKKRERERGAQHTHVIAYTRAIGEELL
jgi:hypothetical protein